MSRGRKPLLMMAALAVMLGMAGLTGAARAAQKLTAVLWRGSPSEHAAVAGLVEGLREQGLDETQVEVVTVEAHGDPEQSRALLTTLVRENPSAMLCVGTPVAEQAVAATEMVPVLFLNVFDPVKAKIIRDWASSGNNAVGVSSNVPIRRRMEYAQFTFAQAQRWAVISSRDPEAVQQVAEVVALGQEFGLLEVSVGQGTTVAELESSARQLIKEADLIFTVDDSLAELAMSRLVAAAGGKPVIGASAAGLEAGAMAGLCVDYRSLGKQASHLLTQIIAGVPTASVPSEASEKVEFIINLKAARTLGVEIPLDILAVADRVLE